MALSQGLICTGIVDFKVSFVEGCPHIRGGGGGLYTVIPKL